MGFHKGNFVAIVFFVLPKWVARDRIFDLDSFRREVANQLNVASSKREEMLDPFCDLLLDG